MKLLQYSLLFLGILFFSTHSFATDKSNIIRIGYQKEGSLFLLKLKGEIDKKFLDKGIKIQWIQFLAGPQLLEALNAKTIDFGETGETPPIFAQAADVPFIYVANEPPKPLREAILVKENSAIQSVADLKGKTIAFNKGSNVQYLVIQALQKAGLSYTDIKPVYLTPSDGLAAFQSGHVDALAIWDPYLAIAQHQLPTKILVNGKGIVDNYEFYLASREYADKNPQLILDLLNEINQLGIWMNNNQQQAATLMAPAMGLSKQIIYTIISREHYGAKLITQAVALSQQKIADTFFQLHLIPKEISISEAVWKKK